MNFSVILATDQNMGIGRGGGIPWSCPADLRRFRKITRGAFLVMGRKTHASMKSVDWGGRTPVVLSSAAEGGHSQKSLADALAWCRTRVGDGTGGVRRVFVIGGKRLYEEALESPWCDHVYCTMVPGQYDCDVSVSYTIMSSLYERRLIAMGRDADAQGCVFQHFARKVNKEEVQYLNLVRRVLATERVRADRTGVGTLSVFGAHMTFDLSHGRMPLLTTKRVFWRAVVEELLWMLRGSTDVAELQSRKVHIWDGNSSREFLDRRGLHHLAEGDIGPAYGFQWRHWGAEYKGKDHEYTGEGVDQIARILRQLREEPHSRRIVLSAWNVCDLDKMALPPCHMFCQFYVSDGKLSCMLYQRSGDIGLGVPFNIASYALLTHILAHMAGLHPGEFHHTIGDAHIYTSHVDALREQSSRTPLPFPTLTVHDRGDTSALDAWSPEDFTLCNYASHPSIVMNMAV